MKIKLDRSNYSLWLAQLVRVLCAHKLMGIVDGSLPCPHYFPFDDDANLTDVVNPNFESWVKKKDQIILGWIHTSLTPTVMSTVAHSTFCLLIYWISSGATTHVTPDVTNIFDPYAYNSLDHVGGVGPQIEEDAFPKTM
ncbi:putative transcription factor interactor and regulator CCHC(Zn) family [Abeliophyllum distichum]|uniref:Transcription factor interactor and regulator CCHC(Zn) family n=1 Tax=Abeliophyllum distichum TaxID=126358 RepID=A0ABD1UMU2_9LAMI